MIVHRPLLSYEQWAEPFQTLPSLLVRFPQCDGALVVGATYDFGKAELRLAEVTLVDSLGKDM